MCCFIKNVKMGSIKLRFSVIISFLLFATIAYSQYNYTNQSVLSSGSWFRIGVTEDGVYSLVPSDLQQLGAGTNLPIQSIRLFGNGGSMMPERNGDANADDLIENPLRIVDVNSDGIFNGNDYILFYGKGPHDKFYRQPQNRFELRRNIYSDTAHYFITVNNGNSLPMVVQPANSGPADYISNSFDDVITIEKDSLNLMSSGRRWFWKDFKYITSHTFNASMPGGFRPDSALRVRVVMAANCVGCNSSYQVSMNGSTLGSVSVGPNNPEGAFAQDGENTFTTFSGAQNFSVTIQRTSPQGQGVDAWLDFIAISGRRNLVRQGTQMHFSDRHSTGNTWVQYTLGNASGTQIWDVTNPVQAQVVTHTNGQFIASGNGVKTFIVFENTNFLRPVLIGAQPNQNLHGLPYADNLVITHPLFYNQAKRLAEYHKNADGLSYHLVTVDEIYNEFSSGNADPVAIRNFVRMFWQRKNDGVHPMPKYLTLFGDGSYDPKTYLNRTYRDSAGTRININTYFVPSWQTTNSFSQGGSTFSTDDYFGIMASGKGGNDGTFLADYLEIGIGRILVRTPQEAEGMVDKFIHYMSNEACMGDWRNRLLLMADDYDVPNPDFLFVPINETLDNIVQTKFPVYNVDKLYLDAYDQVVTAGQRYPDAEKALADKMDKGVLFINYVGHGGERGLTKERLMQTEDVDTWNTINKLPFWVTATCTFTRFDDPQFISAGEYVLMKPDGGGIGLISTSRPIAPSSSQSQAYMNALFTRDTVTGEMPRLGDVVRKGKNTSGGPWAIQPLLLLFGDPALRLAYPEHKVVTQSVTNVLGEEIDTIKATQVVTVTGMVTDQDGFILGDYNGWVYPTVFDKPSSLRTKQNDPGAELYLFEIQKNILFKGKTKVENGSFEFSFKLPLDIDYAFGDGKISYYAENGEEDAHGFDVITVGGSENNCNETQGPTIQLYLNDEHFMNGGISNANPTVFARLYDESGINLSGAGIGHDLMLTLTGPKNEEYFVNDFYEADAGTYQSGSLAYPLRNLPQGEYTLSLRAWDACNNSGWGSVMFTVDTSGLKVNNLYNYPNPTTGGTTFSFEHNLPDTDLQADLRIYTLQGVMVKQIKQNVNSPGFRSTEIYWDGNLDGGGRIASGMYVYTLFLTNGKGKALKASNKLVVTN